MKNKSYIKLIQLLSRCNCGSMITDYIWILTSTASCFQSKRNREKTKENKYKKFNSCLTREGGMSQICREKNKTMH